MEERKSDLFCHTKNDSLGAIVNPQRNPFLHDKVPLESRVETTDKIALLLKETREEVGKVLLKIVPVEAGGCCGKLGQRKDTLLPDSDPGIEE
ncbi:MAG TPA: hypothetical protein VLZ03_12710 [Thermodesulfobacteriota bacterium]|nr:hypothetical protein [Thermodesulfobacteriota bacterium]